MACRPRGMAHECTRACAQRAPRALEAAGAGVPSAQPASMPYSGPSSRSRVAPMRAVTCRSSPTA